MKVLQWLVVVGFVLSFCADCTQAAAAIWVTLAWRYLDENEDCSDCDVERGLVTRSNESG